MMRWWKVIRIRQTTSTLQYCRQGNVPLSIRGLGLLHTLPADLGLLHTVAWVSACFTPYLEARPVGHAAHVSPVFSAYDQS
eukprot:366239-Chlamydomonas_euryale.AAC.33